MKHYIIAKFQENCDWRPMIGAITALFEETLLIPGIRSVRVKPCCVNRPNRYDLMIEMEMDREALDAYDACEAHKKWKQEYGAFLLKKTIFDRKKKKKRGGRNRLLQRRDRKNGRTGPCG